MNSKPITKYLILKSVVILIITVTLIPASKLIFLQELRYKCQNFATDLLDHTRTSIELEILLNYDTKMDFKANDKVMHLERLKLAIKLKQKEVSDCIFV